MKHFDHFERVAAKLDPALSIAHLRPGVENLPASSLIAPDV
jgi:hypothetical protein